MSRKFVRVDLPISNPDGTITLSENIFKKHTALGGASPLAGFFDMAAFNTRTTNAKALRKSAAEKEGKSQSKYNQCAVKCGIAAGQNSQTPGTLYTMTLSIRDFVMLKFRATPEQASEYGFHVVVTQTGGRRNVSVPIPDDTPANLQKLCNDINAKHIADGATSMLLAGEVDMTVYGAAIAAAETLLSESETLRNEKESENDQALQLLGYGEGQSVLTDGTLYNLQTGIRDRLLNKHAGTEEQLSEYGFKVVIGTAAAGGTDAPVHP